MTDERDTADFSPARVPADDPVVIPATEIVVDVDASEDEDLGEDDRPVIDEPTTTEEPA